MAGSTNIVALARLFESTDEVGADGMPTLFMRHDQLHADLVTSHRCVSDVGHLIDSLAGVLSIDTSVYAWQSVVQGQKNRDLGVRGCYCQ